MKNFVVLVAMFVCGGSFVAMAQEPLKTQPSTEQVQEEEKEETVGESTEEAPSTETVEESTSESAE